MPIGIKTGVTYYSDFKDLKSITNPVVDNEVHMKYAGFLSQDWSSKDIDFDYFGYGLKKTKYNRGLLYCDNASKLFSTQKGYVKMVLDLPYPVINGVYSLFKDPSVVNEYILFGVNAANVGISIPGIYAALTDEGIRFEIWSSSSRAYIIDYYSNLSSGNNVFEFIWDSTGIDDFGYKDFLCTMAIKTNGTYIVVGNAPLSYESIDYNSLYILDTPNFMSNLECTIRALTIANDIPQEIHDELNSSSSSSTSSSSSLSSSSISSSSSSSSSGRYSTSSSSGDVIYVTGSAMTAWTPDCIANISPNGEYVYGGISGGYPYYILSFSFANGYVNCAISHNGASYDLILSKYCISGGIDEIAAWTKSGDLNNPIGTYTPTSNAINNVIVTQ